MKIRAKQDFRYENDDLEKGEVYELPDPKAEEAIERGLAERAEEKENEAAWEGMEKRLDEEPAGQVGGWLKVGDVNEGDEIVITGPGEWNDDFARDEDDEPDLVLPVKVSGREYEWRLNSTCLAPFRIDLTSARSKGSS
ncbi:hypothetical protein AKJ41_04020 [candidate division MSBL1 archaeon SCGC-AAA259O05]|uniref:Uncharacterized protein n=1 Tax=candidate division MSBL1 archaeon SCGC-AAA259O05 TaxID=1698271 RepID=A0A133V243_9EURY|nr:hypothetical protein AKJ41_04020 [candidate division MSBL1 archaeon SCGC-AAA259O05]